MSNDLDRRFLLGGIAGAAGISALAAMSKAGPLTPPVGPIGPTAKPVGELEPRTAVNATNTPGGFGYVHLLQTPGSYFLTGNITIPSGQSGLYLGNGVTLDLNGFAITAASNTSSGIHLGQYTTVRNGTIANTATAIAVLNPTVPVTVENILVNGFTTRGLDLGARAVVRNCIVTGQGIVGIESQGDYALVEGCTVTNTAGTGVYLNSFSALRRCAINGCSIGARLGYGSLADESTFATCNHTGIQAGQRSVVTRCTATNITVGAAGNPGVGIDLADGAEAASCSALSCFIGVRASTGGRIIECAADASAGSAVRLTGSANTVDACRISRSSVGIDMTGTGGNYVQKCVFTANINALAVNVAGNWYPTVALGSVNTATNPLASVIG